MGPSMKGRLRQRVDWWFDMNDITDVAMHRHTAKAYDPNKKISPELMEKVRKLVRFSPSSLNIQPWHIILTESPEGKARVSKATENVHIFNKKAIDGASHVLVFCAWNDADEDYLSKILAQEEADGRVPREGEVREKLHEGRTRSINRHRHDLNDYRSYADKQVYLNVGQLALGVAALGLDATIIGGFDAAVLDDEFGLAAKGLHSVLIVSLGYHDAEADHNAARPKSRLTYEEIFTEI